MIYEYNTQSTEIRLKEYGKNLQKLSNYVAKIDDEEKKARLSATLVHLMKQLNPTLKDNIDLTQRLWNHLYYISDFQLELENPPYPQPEKDLISRAPQKVDYGQSEPKYRHYGQNVQLLIDQAIEIEDPKEKEAAIIHVGKLMKRFYMSWNRDNVSDEIIIGHIKELSKRKLDIDPELVKEHDLFKVIVKEQDYHSSYRGGSKKGGRRKGGRRK